MKKGFKVLGLFLLSVFGLIGFGYCIEISDNVSEYLSGYRYPDLYRGGQYTIHSGYCVMGDSSYTSCQSTYFTDNTLGNVNIVKQFKYSPIYCFKSDTVLYNGGSSTCPIFIFQGSLFELDCPECETCPEVDTGSILSGYVAVSDINMSYCVSNDLCPEMSGGYSALYINDIRHESMPFINITIPEEFNWDYSYTGNNTQFDLNIIGYNTDPDYIAGIINTQSTKPNSTDFNNIVSGLIPLLIPGLVIILFVWFIFKFINKIF